MDFPDESESTMFRKPDFLPGEKKVLPHSSSSLVSHFRRAEQPSLIGDINAQPVSDLFDRSKSVEPLLYSPIGPLPKGSERAEIG